ncbi:MAG: hypothetical protein QGI63_02010 [Rhodospirillales bacterium]|jgi:hypothetical protein|nr:hypothetical protein [Rhodospirillales bacterium]MDP6773020.1 hypothetical protein [Rhodospirillales bacterium]
MDEIQRLIAEIEAYCQLSGLAETTFGRRAVNDGKFVGRLRDGKGVTVKTIARLRVFMHENPAPCAPVDGFEAGAPRPAPVADAAPRAHDSEATPPVEAAPGQGAGGERPFRFYDNRQKYLMFVNTCNEKAVVAERAGMELAHVHPRPPALRVFDAGMGDGTVLTRLMRDMHRRFPTVPFFIVGKEISIEDIRLSLEKMPDRFAEHPGTVLVITNLYYTEAPRLMPGNVNAAAALNWHEVPLAGSSSHQYDEQIKALGPILEEGWQVKASPRTGNPLYVRPSVLVIYREDHKFLLDPVIPRPGHTQGLYDLIIASQPYRARMSVDFKVGRVLAPLARGLGPGGRMLTIQSYGRDPGLEVIQRVWPGEEPFQSDRHTLLKALKSELGRTERDLSFKTLSDKRSLFRYQMHTLPTEIGHSIGTSTLFAAWNAAVYVAQIEDERLADAVTDGSYLAATREVLQKHGGLWFHDESFVVTRRRG